MKSKLSQQIMLCLSCFRLAARHDQNPITIVDSLLALVYAAFVCATLGFVWLNYTAPSSICCQFYCLRLVNLFARLVSSNDTSITKSQNCWKTLGHSEQNGTILSWVNCHSRDAFTQFNYHGVLMLWFSCSIGYWYCPHAELRPGKYRWLVIIKALTYTWANTLIGYVCT